MTTRRRQPPPPAPAPTDPIPPPVPAPSPGRPTVDPIVPRRAGAAPRAGRRTRFADRRDAGRALAAARRDGPGDPVVLGLPRGGVVVAAEVAVALGAPLDVALVRKLGLPEQPELAMGAIAAAGAPSRPCDRRRCSPPRVDDETFDAVRERELAELRRREIAYRGGREPIPLGGRDVVLVDDGLATGATMRAAVAAVRPAGPASLTVAVPSAPRAPAPSSNRTSTARLPGGAGRLPRGRPGLPRLLRTTDDEVRARPSASATAA